MSSSDRSVLSSISRSIKGAEFNAMPELEPKDLLDTSRGFHQGSILERFWPLDWNWNIEVTLMDRVVSVMA